jgi:hypothetical protein
MVGGGIRILQLVGAGWPWLGDALAVTTHYYLTSPTGTRPAQQTAAVTWPWAQRPTLPPFRLSTCPPVHLSACPPSHHVPCSRSRMTSLLTLPSRLSPSLLVRPSVSVSAAPPVDSFTRPNHVSERSAQTPAWDDDDDAASNADTNTPTRQGQYEALSCPCSTSNLQLHPITSPNPPASISIPSTSLSCALVSLYRCPTLPCMSLCAISRALSRFHHVIHPTLTPTSTPPISLTHRSIAKTGACSCSHVSPSLQRRLVRKYSSPSYPPSLLPFASPLCSFVKSPPSPPQPANPVQALRCSST